MEAALEAFLEVGELPTAEAVRDLVQPPVALVPQLESAVIDLRSYDSLLASEVQEVAS